MYRRSAPRLVAAVALVAALALIPATANAATGLVYVNMGDSYSAGDGIAPAAPGAPAQCQRSSLNWAGDLATAKGYQLTDVSCSGAQTKDFAGAQFSGVAPQLNALSTATQLVTMTIGGNDDGVFFAAISDCVAAAAKTGGQGSPCQTTYGQSFRNTIVGTTYPNLVKALSAVRSKAPNAKVGISAYLQILPASGGCYAAMPIAAGDLPYLNGIEATLNDVTSRAAKATGVTYIDESQSVGHDACQPIGTRWVEPINGTRYAAQAHPNATGEQAMATRAASFLGLS